MILGAWNRKKDITCNFQGIKGSTLIDNIQERQNQRQRNKYSYISEFVNKNFLFSFYHNS